MLKDKESGGPCRAKRRADAFVLPPWMVRPKLPLCKKHLQPSPALTRFFEIAISHFIFWRDFSPHLDSRC